MYKLLVVDDEKRIREGMAAAVRAAGQFEAYTADSGKTALALLKRQPMDAMLLDISMPDMNGLELLRALKDTDALPLTVVISGYEQFDYAREAMCCGAIDYLLKPVDAEDLAALCARLAERIVRAKARREHESQLQTYVQEHRSDIRQKLLTDILDGRIDRGMLGSIRSVYGIDLRGEWFCAAVILLRRRDADVAEMEFQVALRRFEIALDALLQQPRAFCVNVFNMENARYILLMNGGAAPPAGEVDALLNAALAECAAIPEVRAYIGKGGPADAYEQLSVSYAQANQALYFRSTFGPGVVYDISDYQHNAAQAAAALMLDEIEELARKGRYEQAAERTERLFETLRENLRAFSSAQLRYFLLRSRMMLPMILLRSGMEFTDEMLLEGIRMRGPVGERELRRARDYTLQMLRAIRPQVAETNSSRQRETAAQLRAYVDEHYADNDLSVSGMSGRFGYSANYLGNLFKNAYSVSINDYINQRRVRQAQRLIDETALHIYEIAFRVGFSDQNYFSRIFKKYTGLSPREYRDDSLLRAINSDKKL